jgi:capsule polysaccharide export protein KpsC/LpsZ
MDPNIKMDDKARLQLQKMLKENDVLDQTKLIRELKHSAIMRKEVNILLDLLKEYPSDQDTIQMEGMIQCSFLFNYYTDLFNKIRKKEIDINILFKLIDVLEGIEEEKIDQHEGSYIVGTLLKKIYVDSALRKADMLDKQHESDGKEALPPPEPITISWKEFKHIKKAQN